jgi:hypothetical protein
MSVISWKFPPLYVRDPQLWTGLGWNIGERFFDPLKSKVNCAVPNGLYV